jgi:hypothetical protein
MDIILNQTLYHNLNKDMCNIIFKYINYSLDHLLNISKTVNNNKYSYWDIKYSVLDMIILSLYRGYHGFFVNNELYEYFRDYLDFTQSFIKYEQDLNKHYFFIDTEDDKVSIDIMELDVFEKSKLREKM